MNQRIRFTIVDDGGQVKASTSLFVCSKWTISVTPTSDQELLSHEKWVVFVEKHQHLLTWFDNTEQGRMLSDPSSPSYDPSRTSLGKRRALGNFDKRRGYHKFALDFASWNSTINIVFDGMRPSRSFLLLSLDLAEHMGVRLYDIARKSPMTRAWIEANYPEKTG